jgi:hypothetical protein
MVVDDDRVYPRDALETYLDYSELLPWAVLCFFAVRQRREVWIGVMTRCIPKHSSKVRLA